MSVGESFMPEYCDQEQVGFVLLRGVVGRVFSSTQRSLLPLEMMYMKVVSFESESELG